MRRVGRPGCPVERPRARAGRNDGFSLLFALAWGPQSAVSGRGGGVCGPLAAAAGWGFAVYVPVVAVAGGLRGRSNASRAATAGRRPASSRHGPGGPRSPRPGGATGRYKMLLSCSLIFSSSSFMPTTRCCTVASLALEPMVLISRPISWARKASFLPTASSGCRAASSK